MSLRIVILMICANVFIAANGYCYDDDDFGLVPPANLGQSNTIGCWDYSSVSLDDLGAKQIPGTVSGFPYLVNTSGTCAIVSKLNLEMDLLKVQFTDKDVQTMIECLVENGHWAYPGLKKHWYESIRTSLNALMQCQFERGLIQSGQLRYETMACSWDTFLDMCKRLEIALKEGKKVLITFTTHVAEVNGLKCPTGLFDTGKMLVRTDNSDHSYSFFPIEIQGDGTVLTTDAGIGLGSSNDILGGIVISKNN